MRPRLAGAGSLMHVPCGYFTCDLESLEGLEIVRYASGDSAVALERWLHELFDPKRVRAAQAGVPIVEPLL